MRRITVGLIVLIALTVALSRCSDSSSSVPAGSVSVSGANV